MIPSYRRLAATLLVLPFVALSLRAQVVMSDDFEANNVGVFPAGWVQQSGTSALMFVVDNPVKFGVRAFRVASAISQTHTARFATSISNDYFYDYYIYIPDSGQTNETKGSVKVENVGMQFGLGATTALGTIFFSNAADGWVVTTNEWHHIKVEVDYQKSVALVTLNDTSSRKYMVSISTSSDVRVEALSISTILQNHALFVDSLTVSTGTIDLTPAGPSLNNPSDGEANLNSPLFFSWSSISSQTGYNLQIATDSTFQTGIVHNDTSLSGTSTNVGIPPLAPMTDYYWRVRAKNSIGWGEWSVVRRFRTVDPPSAPTLSSPGDGQVMTSTDQWYSYWSSPSNSVGYHIQVSEDSNFTVFVINDSSLSSNNLYLTHPPLQVNKTYYWRVRAVGPAGWGPFSNRYMFKTLQPPGAPTLSSPANANIFYTTSDIYHSWNFVSTATSYHLQIAEDTNFTVIVFSDTNVATTNKYVAHPPLAFNKTYYWRVRAKNTVGWGAYSTFRSYMTLPVPMAVTMSQPANNSTQSAASVSFYGYVSYPEEADSFRVQIATDTNFTNIVVDAVVDDNGSLSVPMSTFAAGTTYYWRMSGRNMAGFGPFMSRSAFTTASLPLAPPLSQPADDEDANTNPVYFDWSSVTGAVEYQLQLATDAGFTNIVLDTSGLGSTFLYIYYPPLQFTQTYYWRVRARANVGWGPFADALSFSTQNPPSVPVLSTPAPGTTQLFGNTFVSWVNPPGSDSTIIEIATDTNSAPASRVIGAAFAKGSNDLTYWRFAVYYYAYVYLNLAEIVGLNKPFWLRLRSYNEAGYGSPSPWYSLHSLTPPQPPTNVFPQNGAENVPFSSLTFFGGVVNASNTTDMNITAYRIDQIPAPPPILNNAPMSYGYIDDEFGSPVQGFFRTVSNLETNALYEYVLTIFNPAGSAQTPPIQFRTADPTPHLACTGDIEFDQGGYVGLKLKASGLDFAQCPGGPSSCITEYYVWRLWLPTEVCECPDDLPARVMDAKAGIPEKIRAAVAPAESVYIWEPLYFFKAIGQPTYAMTVKTRRDSATGHTYVERYVVTAHSGSGRFWATNMVEGYSIDNLAPAQPAGGSAVPENGNTMRVNWSQNDEKDLKDYTIYRSLSGSEDVSALVPIGTTTQPTFLDVTPPHGQVIYYYVVANDVNGNKSDPAIIQSSGTTGVEQFGGIPTEYSLSQNFPNPFNPATTITFGLPKESNVELQVLNTLGQVVQTIVTEVLPAGYHRIRWQGNVPSGLYIYRISAKPADGSGERFTSIRKMVLLK